MFPGAPALGGSGGFSAGPSLGGGEQIHHFGGITIRVWGQGNLVPTWFTTEHTRSKQLVPMVLTEQTTGKQPFRLGGFVSQRASLELRVSQINELFRINRIVIWVKPLWTSYPG